MILVLGGTFDSRKAVEALLSKEFSVLYSSVTAYNKESLPKDTRLFFHTGQMTAEAMADLIRAEAITACVDATHPYALAVSLNAIDACEKTGVPYLRLERPGLMDDGENILGFSSYTEVVAYLKKQAGRILLTTGSRQLEAYSELERERLTLRVLPASGVLEKCEGLGYKPKDIIAMQGPFSYEMNVLLLRQFDIRFLVTKDSGEVGGVLEKIRAARDCGAVILFIKRPDVAYPEVVHTAEAAAEWAAKNLSKQHEG